MNSDLFGRAARVVFVAVTTASFVFSIGLSIVGEATGTPTSSGADTFSASAIGHRAFARLLESLAVPVVVSRTDTARQVEDGATLVVLEPQLSGSADKGELRRMLGAARRALLVLPKWRGDASPRNPEWIRRAEAVPLEAVRAALAAADVDVTVLRPRNEPEWTDLAPVLDSPQVLQGAIEPIVASDRGVLLGRVRRSGDRELYVLSDPDVLSNHGLGRGKNALLAIRAVEAARGGEGVLVIDETLHGFRTESSLARDALAFPLGIVLGHGALAAVVLLATSLGRFGAPMAAPADLAPGKSQLIEGTAALLRLGGHSGHSLTSYWHGALQDVARRVHAPPGLDKAGLLAWLQRATASVGVGEDLAALDRLANAASPERTDATVVATACRIYEWKEEMLHGARRDPRPG